MFYMTPEEILGIMINKIFFRGGLKVKDAPETAKNARNLPSLINYLIESSTKQKPGAIGWFTKQKYKEFNCIKECLNFTITDETKISIIINKIDKMQKWYINHLKFYRLNNRLYKIL